MSKLTLKKNNNGYYDLTVNGKSLTEDMFIKSIDIHVDADSVPTATLAIYLPDGIEIDDIEAYISCKEADNDRD